MIKQYLKKIPIDIITIFFSIYITFLLRFEFKMPSEFRYFMLTWVTSYSIIQMTIFLFFGMYNRIWRFTGIEDLISIFKINSLVILVTFTTFVFITSPFVYPRSVIILFFILNTLFLCSSRILIRIYFSFFIENQIIKNKRDRRKLVLIGAGKCGDKIAREIISSTHRYQIIGFIDDDPLKKNARLHGFEVLSNLKDFPKLKFDFDEIIICIPSASRKQIKKVIHTCELIGKPFKTVPSIAELIDRKVSLKMVRNVSYVDLLGRDEVKLDMNLLGNFLRNRRILISGAGGSIGSELFKQCLAFSPSEMICIDFNEEKVFNLESELNKDTKIKQKFILLDITNKNQLEKVFIDYHPEIIFHAAAYKHVPIQEIHPWTAVDTNIGGTINIVELANKYNANKFVLVSTDKAVNPTNIMGATKRISEKIVKSMNLVSKTKYMAVRFGNVLGSSGSAIPKFENQINSGGPVTITHPSMTRYFMSIPEASQLILQCGSFGKDGETFLLDMGEPIKIVQIVNDLIKLSGFKSDEIPIIHTGLRPGEKLFEELKYSEEESMETKYDKIMVLKGKEIILPWEELKKSVKNLLRVSKTLDHHKIKVELKNLVPSYKMMITSAE